MKAGMANKSGYISERGLFFFCVVAGFALIIALLDYVPIFLAFLNFPWNATEWLMFLQLIVFLGSAIVAVNTIQSNRKTSIERVTLDIILADNKDAELYDAKNAIFTYAKDPKKYFQRKAEMRDCSPEKEKTNAENGTANDRKYRSLSQLCELEAKDLDADEYDVKKKLMYVLNRHEFYAAGINSGLLDEQLFKRLHCANFIRVWDVTHTAVSQIRSRTKIPTIIKDLEILADRWKKNPLKPDDLVE